MKKSILLFISILALSVIFVSCPEPLGESEEDKIWDLGKLNENYVKWKDLGLKNYSFDYAGNRKLAYRDFVYASVWISDGEENIDINLKVLDTNSTEIVDPENEREYIYTDSEYYITSIDDLFESIKMMYEKYQDYAKERKLKIHIKYDEKYYYPYDIYMEDGIFVIKVSNFEVSNE